MHPLPFLLSLYLSSLNLSLFPSVNNHLLIKFSWRRINPPNFFQQKEFHSNRKFYKREIICTRKEFLSPPPPPRENMSLNTEIGCHWLRLATNQKQGLLLKGLSHDFLGGLFGFLYWFYFFYRFLQF